MAKKKNLLQSMEEDRRNRRTFRQAMAKELREHKSSFLVFSVLRILSSSPWCVRFMPGKL